MKNKYLYDDFPINKSKPTKNKDKKSKTTKEVYNSKYVRIQQSKIDNSNAKKKIL